MRVFVWVLLGMLALPAAAEEAFVCLPQRVLDGDTLECHDGRRVRLWAVDAPELDTPDGEAAAAALQALVRRTALVCLPRGESYGRTVAQCFLDVALTQVAHGYATPCLNYGGRIYAPFVLRDDLPRRRSCR